MENGPAIMEPKKEENLVVVSGNKNEKSSRNKSPVEGADEENNAKKPESKETTKKSRESGKEKKLEKKLSRGEISKEKSRTGKKSGKSKNKNAENTVNVDPDSGSLGDAETEEDSLQRALEIAADSIFKYPNY